MHVSLPRCLLPRCLLPQCPGRGRKRDTKQEERGNKNARKYVNMTPYTCTADSPGSRREGWRCAHLTLAWNAREPRMRNWTQMILFFSLLLHFRVSFSFSSFSLSFIPTCTPTHSPSRAYHLPVSFNLIIQNQISAPSHLPHPPPTESTESTQEPCL